MIGTVDLKILFRVTLAVFTLQGTYDSFKIPSQIFLGLTVGLGDIRVVVFLFCSAMFRFCLLVLIAIWFAALEPRRFG